MSTKSKLLAMTENLQLPSEAAPRSLTVDAMPTGAAATTDGSPQNTKFPPVTPGPVARTGPGQMLQFRGQMLAVEGELGKLRDQLKQIYASTIGMLGSSTHMAGRVGYAPERRHMIIAKARTNILRRIATIGQETGRYPVAVIADTVLYTSPDPDPVASWPGGSRWMGRELGRYKVVGSAPLKEHLQFLSGGIYKGKDAIADRVAGAE